MNVLLLGDFLPAYRLVILTIFIKIGLVSFGGGVRFNQEHGCHAKY